MVSVAIRTVHVVNTYVCTKKHKVYNVRFPHMSIVVQWYFTFVTILFSMSSTFFSCSILVKLYRVFFIQQYLFWTSSNVSLTSPHYTTTHNHLFTLKMNLYVGRTSGPQSSPVGLKFLSRWPRNRGVTSGERTEARFWTKFYVLTSPII